MSSRDIDRLIEFVAAWMALMAACSVIFTVIMGVLS